MVKASSASAAAAAAPAAEKKAAVGEFSSPRAPFRNVTDAILKRLLTKQCGAERVQAKLTRRAPAKGKKSADGGDAAAEAATAKDEKEPATILSRSKLTNRASALLQVLLGHQLKKVLNLSRVLTRAATQTCQGPEELECAIHILGLPYRHSERHVFSTFDPDVDMENKTLVAPHATLLNALRRIRSSADRLVAGAPKNHPALTGLKTQHATLANFCETVVNGTSTHANPLIAATVVLKKMKAALA